MGLGHILDRSRIHSPPCSVGGGCLEPRVEEDSEGQPDCRLGGPGPLATSPVGMEGDDSEGAMSLPSLHYLECVENRAALLVCVFSLLCRSYESIKSNAVNAFGSLESICCFL